ALFIPQLLFVPLMQAAVNRRAGARIRLLRQLGIGVIDQSHGHFRADERRIERAFALDMGIFRIKFTMKFLMNLFSPLQIVLALLIGGWWVYTDRLAIGGVVAFISGIGRRNDPWGDLVNYFSRHQHQSGQVLLAGERDRRARSRAAPPSANLGASSPPR